MTLKGRIGCTSCAVTLLRPERNAFCSACASSFCSNKCLFDHGQEACRSIAAEKAKALKDMVNQPSS